MANLPQTGNARAQAEAQRLGQRLAEVQQASATGDEAATEAALTAYASILAEATSGSAGDPEAQKTLEAAVTRHIAVLTALADRVPAPAQAAIQRALVSSTAALDGLHGAGGGSGTPAGNGGGSDGGTGANPGRDQGTPGANGDPVKSAQPGGGKPSAKPDKPAPTNKPAKTNHPNPTPRNGPNGPPATSGPNNPPHKGPAQ